MLRRVPHECFERIKKRYSLSLGWENVEKFVGEDDGGLVQESGRAKRHIGHWERASISRLNVNTFKFEYICVGDESRNL